MAPQAFIVNTKLPELHTKYAYRPPLSLASSSSSSSSRGFHVKARLASQFSGLRATSRQNSRRMDTLRSRSTRKNTRDVVLGPRCAATKVKIRLKLDHQVQFGESHALMGSAKSFGSWKKPIPMNWSESGWLVDLEVDSGERVEFKYVIVLKNGEVVWENGSNRVLEISKGGSVEIVSTWNDTKSNIVLNTKEDIDSIAATNETAESSPSKSPSTNGRATNGSAGVTIVDDKPDDSPTASSFSQEWQGRNIEFMRSNEHKRSDVGKWDTTGLEGSALFLVNEDKQASNWRRKLEVVLGLLTGDLVKTNRLDALIDASIYLKWINTGQIQCFEDGGHHRPNRHAEISRQIFRELERWNSAGSLSPQELLVIRKIHPTLPSFKAEFTASVPLTRIRDIAHRNDIPHDLKQEIKHTIQNKLHRNAGPEDLISTELLLARVTQTPGQYSAAFIEQLKIFFSELKDFFNAGSLTEQLDSIRSSLDERGISVLDEFIANKKKLDSEGSSNNKGTDMLIATMHSLTGLRAVLMKGLESGLRNDAPDTAIAMRQKWRLCEIGLEDYLFVLLSRFANDLDALGGSTMLASEALAKNMNSWNHPLGAMVLGIRHLGLSGWQQAECMAIENEILAWQSMGMAEKEGNEEGAKIWALRYKATIERARRLSESFSDMLLQVYPEKVEKLGKAFGIPENTVRTYTEAEIRASVVFQVSKLCSLLLKATRTVAGEEGWDPLVPGVAVGTLVEVGRIVPDSISPSAGPVILLVRHADGDEEVKASGENIHGVILLQELPHLSHLGVRARQEKVVFVTCEDEDKVAKVRNLVGCKVKLEANTNSVQISVHEGRKTGGGNTKITSEQSKVSAKSETVVRSKIEPSPSGTVLDLAAAEVQTSGAKAYSCGQLATLSKQAEHVYNDLGIPAAFYVPMGKVIPFGAMEAALKSSGDFTKFSELLAKTEMAKVRNGELDNICSELQNIVEAQRVSEAVIDDILTSMPQNARLIVRSSANVEDLAGMSGAGLYESIPNVKASEPESFGKAVAQVWASLYTRRAVLSRRVAGVPQKEAAMAVLVQELLSPQLSFVLHTVDPIEKNEKLVSMEIASGLGETLASGTRGTPWRMAVDKFDGAIKTMAFANFSEELVVDDAGIADGSMKRRTVDYTTKPLSRETVARQKIGQQLATIGFFLEQNLGAPQDVEGCIVGDKVYIVQSRPQPL